MRFLKYFINLICIVTVVMFFIENSVQLSARTKFTFDLFIPGFAWEFPELPLYFLLLLVFAVGAMLTVLSFAWGRWRIGRDLHRANSRIHKLEKEIKAYRQLPLGSDESKPKEPKLPSIQE